MKNAVTVLVPFTLTKGKTEQDMVDASNQFQEHFVNHHEGVLRREIIKTGERSYTDIVQFRSREDAERVIAAEAASEDCQAFFSVMDLNDMDERIDFYPSLATYTQDQ